MRNRENSDLLFSSGDLQGYLSGQTHTMENEIEGFPEDLLLNTPVADLVDELVARYSCESLELRPDETSISDHEVTIPIEEVRDGRLLYPDETTSVRGHCIQFHVPFSGDSNLFRLRGSLTSYSPPRADVQHGELVYAYRFVTRDDSAQVKARFEREVKHTKELVSNSANYVRLFNNGLADEARRTIEHRRTRLLETQNTVASLGYPMRRRADAAETYVVPSVRKKLTAKRAAPRSAATTIAFRPEPALDEGQYEDIIKIVENMAMVLERSPSMFRTLDEEGVRSHFLVQLNGQFDGNATGETFNANGKTDILIRVEDRNIFIAECKFWRGPAGFTGAIDQLLGYTSWRDTKTALIVFNRDAQMSTVLDQIPGLLSAHTQFKRSIKHNGETRFRAVFRQPTDPNRELTITVLVFSVPG